MVISQTILKEASIYYQNDLNKRSYNGQQYQTAFLCHSHLDEKLVQGLIVEFSRRNIMLYVDWLDHSMPKTPCKETAQKIQLRIKQANIFIFFATKNSVLSHWCPWEIGFADGIGKVPYILPTIDENFVTYGKEYLEIYPDIDKFLQQSKPSILWRTFKITKK